MKRVINKTNKQKKEQLNLMLITFYFTCSYLSFPGLLDSVLASSCFLLNLVTFNSPFSSSPVTLFQVFDQVFIQLSFIKRMKTLV